MLYEEVHGQKLLGNRDVQRRFLRTLASLLPAHVAPIIIADAGFKVPFYREAERLGWRCVGRVRGRDFLRLKHRWVSCKRLFERVTATPTSLGVGDWVRSNPIPAMIVLVRLAPKRTARQQRPRQALAREGQPAQRSRRQGAVAAGGEPEARCAVGETRGQALPPAHAD